MSTHSTSYDTQGIPRLPALPTQALRLLKTTHRSPKVTAMGGGHITFERDDRGTRK